MLREAGRLVVQAGGTASSACRATALRRELTGIPGLAVDALHASFDTHLTPASLPSNCTPVAAELPSSAGAYVEDGIPLCIQRQAVRLLAMLASDKAGAAAVQDAGWIPWLQDLAVSSDLKLSSCASRALLHIESATAAQRPGLAKLALPLHAMPAPLLPLEQQGTTAAAAAAAGQAAVGDAARPPSPVVAEAAEMLGEARQKMAQVGSRCSFTKNV